jgi:hypothetical protein
VKAIHLDLDERDVRELVGALDRHLLVLRTELADTDDREYHRALRESLERLERIRTLLAEPIAA